MAVDENTSIGPAENPAAEEKHKVQARRHEVDAQAANEFDSRQGLAGAESKPLAGQTAKKREQAFSSQPGHDPNQGDPNRRTDMATERRQPGLHGGGGDPGRKKS